MINLVLINDIMVTLCDFYDYPCQIDEFEFYGLLPWMVKLKVKVIFIINSLSKNCLRIETFIHELI